MTEAAIGKAVIQAEVDGSGVDAGVSAAKRSLASLGTAAAAAGRQASAGLDAIGAGGQQAAGKLDAATARMVAAIQRQTVAVSAGAKSNASYFEGIASQRGANLQVLGPYIQQLKQAEAAAEAAAVSQRKISQGADLIAGLQAQVGAIGKTRFELLELKAAQLGIATQAAPLIAQLKAANAPLGQLGATGAATAQQLRQVAPQVTDIVTQLAAGQSPLQIFIQQGGQLKDVFGGAAPAARALGGYLLSLINPLTIGAVAAAGLGYAWYKGAQEGKQFNEVVILQGNSAGVTTSQLREMARGIAAITGTEGAAVETLVTLAREGKLTGDQLQRIGTIASQLDRVVGKSVAETAKEFASLKDAPVEASLRLNQQYNYLTASVYAQIKALKDQGRETDAARLAQDAFAGALESRLPALAANVGLLGKAWRGVADAAKLAGDFMLSIGRSPELQDRIESARKNAASLREQIASREARGLATGNLPAMATAAESLVASLTKQLDLGTANAATSEKQLKSVEARAKWDQLTESSLTKQQKLAREIAQARETAAKAGVSDAELSKQLANIREKYAESDPFNAGIEKLKQSLTLREQLTRENIEKIQYQYRTGALSQITAIRMVSEEEIKQLQAERQSLVERLAIASKKKDSLREVAELQGQIALKDVQIQAAQGKTDRTIGEIKYQATLKETIAQIEQQTKSTEELNAANRQAQAEWDATAAALRKYQRAVEDDNDDLEYQIRVLGLTGRALALANEQRRIELNLRAQLRDIEDRNLPAEEAARARDQARATAAQASAQAETRIYVDEWRRANDAIGSGLYDALTSRGENARQKLQRIFADLVLRPTIIAALQPISGALASAVTPGGSAGILGSLNTAGSLGGLANTLGFGSGSSVFTQFATSGLGNTLGLSTTVDAIGGLGTASTSLTGLGSALSAAAPYLAAAVAVASIFGGKKGGPKDIGSYGQGAIGPGFVRGDTNTASNTAVKSFVDAIGSSYASAIKALGGRAGTLETGGLIGADPRGDSNTQLITTSYLNGRLIYDRNNSGQGGNFEDVGRSQEALQAAITEASARAVLSALKASDLPVKVADYFKQLDPLQLSAADIQTSIDAATSAQTLWRSVDQLGAGFANITSLSVESTAKLLAAAGGLDKAQEGLANYYQLFYSEDERTALSLAAVQKSMAALGLSSIDTLPEFRGVVESLDLSTDAGIALRQSLIELAPSFAAVYRSVDAVQTALDALNAGAVSYFTVLDAQQMASDLSSQAQAGIDAFIGQASTATKGLFDGQINAAQAASNAAAAAATNWQGVADAVRATLGSLQVETQQLARLSFTEIYDQFKTLSVLARGGSVDAANRLSDVARQAVDASGRSSLTLVDYLRDRARIERGLADTLGTAEKQVTVQQSIRDAAQSQIVQLQAINSTLTGFSASVYDVLTKGYAGADRDTANSISGVLARMASDFSVFFGQYAEGQTVQGAGGAVFTRLSGANASFTDAQGNVSYFRQSDNIVDLAKRNPALRAYWEAQYGIRLPSFAVGTNYVPRDMIAQLHEGEAIVPRPFNPAAHRGAGVWTGGQGEPGMAQLLQLTQGMYTRLGNIEKRLDEVERRTLRWEKTGLAVINQPGTTLEVAA